MNALANLTLLMALTIVSFISFSSAGSLRGLQSVPTIQTAMLQAVNAERTKLGLAPMCSNYKLHESAQRHSNDMATNNFMGHTGSDGSKFGQRIADAGFVRNGAAENVAAGQATVEAVMKFWMGSSVHRSIILGDYKFFGVGYGYNANTRRQHFWTQDFANSVVEVCDL